MTIRSRQDQEATLELMGYKQVDLDIWKSPKCKGGRVVVIFRESYVNAAALEDDDILLLWRNADDARVALAKLQQALQEQVDIYQSLVAMVDMARRPNGD